MLEEQAFGHVKELHLRVVRVANASAREELGGPADVREGIGQQAARGGLGNGKALVLRAKEVGAYLCQRVVPAGHEILAEETDALISDRPHLLQAEFAARRAQPAIDMPRMCAKGDAQAAPVAVENRLELRLKHRFPNPRRADLDVGLALQHQAE